MITTAVILVAVLGGVFGLVLATASKKFAVEEDPRIGEITNLLPGANCGGCGFAGCTAISTYSAWQKSVGAQIRSSPLHRQVRLSPSPWN